MLGSSEANEIVEAKVFPKSRVGDRPRFLAACGLRLGLALALGACAEVPVNLRSEGPKVALLDGRKVHYSVTGRSGPVLVLVHGWACDERVWWKNVPALSQSHCVMAIDLPGHGQSAPPARPYDMSLFADGIAAVLDAEGVDQAVLIGHSNGVPAVRQFYRKYPHRCARLVLIDGPLELMVPAEQVSPIEQAFEAPEFAATVAQFVASMPAPHLAQADRARIAEIAASQSQSAVLGGFRAAVDPTIWGRDPITIPVLMINAHQPAWSPEYEDYVRELIPKLDYRVLSDVGHFIMVERPETVNEWLSEFVRPVPREVR